MLILVYDYACTARVNRFWLFRLWDRTDHLNKVSSNKFDVLSKNRSFKKWPWRLNSKIFISYLNWTNLSKPKLLRPFFHPLIIPKLGSKLKESLSNDLSHTICTNSKCFLSLNQISQDDSSSNTCIFEISNRFANSLNQNEYAW